MSEPTRVRASSWSRLFDCAYAWEGEHLLDYRKPAGMRALLGSSLHHGTAVFDQSRIDHDEVTVDVSVGAFVDMLNAPKFEVDYTADDLQIREAERIGIKLLQAYCTTISPQYYFAAVELETKPFDIDCGGGIVIRLTGTMDRSRAVIKTGKHRIIDLKSGTRAVQKGAAATKGHGPQFGTYRLLSEHTTGVETDETSEIIGLKTSGKPEVAKGYLRGAKRLMTGNAEYPGLIEIAAQMFRTGLFPPNTSSILCAKKYCARWDKCPYHL